ncbi:MAG: hypothetical protein JXB10_11130 [Pirellulales bacterium]|nr:hypothetical protein [Pirellulales bacterium]
MHRLPHWLRWLFVLPAAVLAYALFNIAIPLIFVVVDLLEIKMTPAAAALGDYLPQLLSSIAGPYAFVWCGTYTAPSHRSDVAIALGSFGVAFYVILTPFCIAINIRSPLWWLVLSNLISIASAIIAVVMCRRGQGWFPTGD